jgi:hypothetical protein
MTQGLIGGDASAEKRACFGGIEGVRHLRESFDWRDHVFSVAAVVTKAGDLHLSAIAEITPAAVKAGVVVSTVPPDADALTLLPGCDAGTELGYNSGNFVAG